MNEKILKEIIINTINGEQHLGENLKKQCIKYFDFLQQENKQLKEINEEHKKLNGELREENNRLYKSLEELSQYKYDREEEDMMNYLIEQEEVFNDYSFMEE